MALLWKSFETGGFAKKLLWKVIVPICQMAMLAVVLENQRMGLSSFQLSANIVTSCLGRHIMLQFFWWKRLCYNHTPGIGPKQVVSYFARHLNDVFNSTQRDYFSELLKNILSQIMSSLAGSYLLAPFAMPKSNKSCEKLPGKHISRCIPLSPSQGCPEPPN